MRSALRSLGLLGLFGAVRAVSACSADAADAATEAPPDVGETKRDGSAPTPGETPRDAGSSPDAAPPLAVPDPVVFVHGINGSSANFKVMIDRLVADGWPKERLSAIDFPDPKWGCNTENADTLKAHVAKVLAETGAKKIDLVAHSMGSLSSRRFVRDLGGAAIVSTYVTLGGPHHGVPSSCLNPLPVCVWKELCGSEPYLTALNTPPVTPGPAIWVSIFSHDDGTIPADSSKLDDAENIPFDGVEHDGENGLLQRPEVYAEVKRVLAYPNP